jgi:aspartate/methionine/tyrosine aminotransferase
MECRHPAEEETMKKYSEMSREELLSLKNDLEAQYKEVQAQGLALDMSRGKPGKDQLDLSMGMMEVLANGAELKCETGVDCRNYGVIDGIPEAKRLLGEMSEVDPDHIIIYGNSSLNVMFDSIARSMTHGVLGHTPWCKLDKVKFLCPVPGYDRHFKITEFFGIEMINVPMHEDGPDMDMVEKLVSEDEAIKGIWCVPKYSNPQGITYSKEVVERFARLKPAAPDFRIYWDNAYSIHHLNDENQDFLQEILGECVKAGNPDLVYKFTSTSKVSFPGSGIAAVAASRANLEDFRQYMQVQTIGHDKLNQLRHVRFFKDLNGLHEHMRKHANLIRPKFEIVLDTLECELDGLGIGEWTKPHGGYFISFDSLPGCAKAIVQKAKEAGVVMTGAGATYPYGKDPQDSNIRIAPTYPSKEELAEAVKVFVLCVKLASVEKLLEQ